jgi:hypothetical protein
MKREISTEKIALLIAVAFLFDTLGFVSDLVPFVDLILVPMIEMMGGGVLWFMVKTMFPSWANNDVIFSKSGMAKVGITAAVKLVPILGGILPGLTFWAWTTGTSLRIEENSRLTKKQSTAPSKSLRPSAVY